MKNQQNQKKSVKITEASEYLGVSINTLKMLANSGKNLKRRSGEGGEEMFWVRRGDAGGDAAGVVDMQAVQFVFGHSGDEGACFLSVQEEAQE